MRNRPVYNRLAAGGFVLFLMGLVVVFFAEPDARRGAEFFIALAVLAIAGAVLTLRFRRGAIAGLVISIVLLLLTFWSVFPLAIGPASVFDFTIGLLLTVGKFIALIACILALVKRREGRTEWGPKGRAFVRYGPIVLGVMIVLSAILSAITDTTVPAADREGAFVVVMHDNAFVPNALDAKAGAATAYLVRNEGRIAHSFTIPGTSVDGIVLPGSEKLFSVLLERASDFECVFHEGMSGKIAVA